MRWTLLPVVLCVLAACGTAPDEPVSPSIVDEPQVSSSDFTDAEGRLICPVMGDVIASKEQAVGHTEFDDRTYWFCCDSCQHMFADDPERYADGKYVAHLAEAHDGKFGRCNHLL